MTDKPREMTDAELSNTEFVAECRRVAHAVTDPDSPDYADAIEFSYWFNSCTLLCERLSRADAECARLKGTQADMQKEIDKLDKLWRDSVEVNEHCEKIAQDAETRIAALEAENADLRREFGEDREENTKLRAQLAAQGEWVACSERLPEERAPVWVSTGSDEMRPMIVELRRNVRGYLGDMWEGSCGMYALEQFKFWQPLPIPPAPTESEK